MKTPTDDLKKEDLGTVIQPSQIDAVGADVLLDSFRKKVPLIEFKNSPAQLSEKIKAKTRFLLQGYAESPQKRIVTDIIESSMIAACVAYGIDPLELIIIPTVLEKNDIAMVSSKKIGTFSIHNLFINPSEIMFRVELLIRYGVETSKNITDILFVIVHEMAHIGQFLHAEDEFYRSKFFGYSEKPTEKHADEVALGYCRNLLDQRSAKSDKDQEDELLLMGLPKTILQAENHKRPIM